ncbi:M81 family metallopeptidase [Pseudoruegeria sp. HB172150]|uniref:M81 family metallopeptidase n=1 Tax=Pseudoruegeria sp. HB172150 TaxID=2721164 RepID=UPI0015567148|nr:M81 family metallopeptidase [Pseudoruegeria sp. HB172150]
MTSKRIAVLGFRHEAMIACPFLTDESTTMTWYLDELLDVPVTTLTGVFDTIAAEDGFEAVPLLFCRTLPGGGFERGLYEKMKGDSLNLLKEHGLFDGVLVLNHGAGETDGLGVHADTDYIVAVREVVGPDIPITVPFDHHGQVTQELLDAIDAMACLRTAPHRDNYETSVRATKQLIDIMKTGRKPKKAAVHIPMMIPGEKCMTDYAPAKDLFGMLPDYDALPGVTEAHIFVGFGWNDLPWCGMKAVVTHETSEEEALRLAREIADKVWARRKEFGLKMPTAGVREGLEQAAAAPEKIIYLADSGDNTTCGAGGDLTFVLQEAIDLDMQDIIIGGIYAPDLVDQCIAAGVDSEVTLELGHHISARKQIKTVTAKVLASGDAVDTSAYTNLRGNDSPWAKVQIGGVIATFHSARVSFTGPGHFEAVGVDPTAHKIYVVKVGYLHPQQEDIMNRNICLLSEGVGALDFTLLEYSKVKRPCFPMDGDMEWSSIEGVFEGNKGLLATA